MKFTTTASTAIIVFSALMGSVLGSGWGDLAKTAGGVGGDALSIGGKAVARNGEAAVSAAVAQSARTVQRAEGFFVNPKVQALKPVQVGPSAGAGASSSSLAAGSASKDAAKEGLIKSLQARIALGRVVFLLDITGSMGPQLDLMKRMIASFCAEDRNGIDIHVWTFTEAGSNCYVDASPLDLKGSQLVNYVKGIKLGAPPSRPDVFAHGGDGPENVVAAVAHLTERFSSNHNILCFVITDASPHYSIASSSEARAEQAWLRNHGHQETDCFALLARVVSSLNITMVPVLYGSASGDVWYHQAAGQTEGLLLSPHINDAEKLCRGLVSILETLQHLTSGVASLNQNAIDKLIRDCQAFKVGLIDQDSFEVIVEEPGRLVQTINYTSESGAMTAALVGLIDTAYDRFRGKKSGKRCYSVNPQIIQLSVKLLTVAMLYGIDSKLVNVSELDSAAQSLKDHLSTNETATSAYEMRLLEQHFTEIALESDRAVKRIKTESTSVSCIISLDSALSFLDGLESNPSSEEDVKAWMDIVLQSIMCQLINVVFPLDALGNQDFADSWSAIITRHSPSTLSASSALALRSPDGMFQDPSDRLHYNSLLIIGHPNDQTMSLCFRLLTALPSLVGTIAGYFVSGQLKVFPSLTSGLQVSTLMSILQAAPLDTNISQSNYDFARCIIHSLRISAGSMAGDVERDLVDRATLNPADSVAKLLAVFIRIDSSSRLCMYENLFDEFAGYMVAYAERRRRTDEAYASDLPTASDIANLLITEPVKGFDPLKTYHSAETALKTFKVDGTVMKKIQSRVAESNEFIRCKRIFKLICDLLEMDCSLQEKEGVAWNTACPLSDSIMLKRFSVAVLLKKRSNRYSLDGETWSYLSENALVSKIKEICISAIEESFRYELSLWKATRRDYAIETLAKKAAAFSGTFEECVSKLEKLDYNLLDETYKLSRMEVPLVLPLLKKSRLESLGVALVKGSWTSEPPAQLRRSATIIASYFAAHPSLQIEISAAISAKLVCKRETPNRHGHTILFPFPGIANWDEEYDAARRSTGRGIRQLDAMKIYSQKCKDLLVKVQASHPDLAAKVASEIQSFEEAYNFDKLLAIISEWL